MDGFVPSVILGVDKGMMAIAGLDRDLNVRMSRRPGGQLPISEVFSNGPRGTADFAIVEGQLLQLINAAGGHDGCLPVIVSTVCC